MVFAVPQFADKDLDRIINVIRTACSDPLPLGEGAKREPVRAKPQKKVMV